MRRSLLATALIATTPALAGQRYEPKSVFTMTLPPLDALRGRFTFPSFTIENVAVVDADHIIVGNDNHLPPSAGRHLLRVPALLRAR